MDNENNENKKYVKLTWYEGDVCGENIKNIFSTRTVPYDPVVGVPYDSVLPEEVRRNIYYLRITYISDTVQTVDYGSYSKFIKAEVIA